MPHSAEDVRGLLCRLGDHVRAVVTGARGIDMATVEGAGKGGKATAVGGSDK